MLIAITGLFVLLSSGTNQASIIPGGHTFQNFPPDQIVDNLTSSNLNLISDLSRYHEKTKQRQQPNKLPEKSHSSTKSSHAESFRIADLSFGPIDALQNKVDELDKKANKHWQRVFNQRCRGQDRRAPKFPRDFDNDGTVEEPCPFIPSKVRNYWKNNPDDAPDDVEPGPPSFIINRPENNADTNESAISVIGSLNEQESSFNIEEQDSVTIEVCLPNAPKDNEGNPPCGLQDTAPVKRIAAGIGEGDEQFQFIANSVELDAASVKAGCVSLSDALGGGEGILDPIFNPDICADITTNNAGDEREVIANLHSDGPTTDILDTKAVTVFFDTEPLTPQINSPNENEIINALETEVSGEIKEIVNNNESPKELDTIQVWSTGPISPDTVTLNSVNDDGSWSISDSPLVQLAPDTQTIKVKVTDTFTNTRTADVTIFADTFPIFDTNSLSIRDSIILEPLKFPNLDGSGKLADTDPHQISVKLSGADSAFIVYDTSPNTPNAISNPADTISMELTDPGDQIWSGTIPESVASDGDSLGFILKGVDVDDNETTVLDREGKSFIYEVDDINVGPLWYVNINREDQDIFTNSAGNENNDGDSDAPFQKIQSAIDRASINNIESDTIFVDYDEQNYNTIILRENNLNIVGANTKDTPNSTVITANRLQRAITSEKTKNNTIKNLTVQEGQIGITFSNVSNYIIENVTVSQNNITGISILDSNKIILRNNTLRNNGGAGSRRDGGLVVGGSNFTIENNIARKNPGFGLNTIELTDSLIKNNEMETNSIGGLRLTGSSRNKILQNSISENDITQILIEESRVQNDNPPTNNFIQKNNITFGDNNSSIFINDGSFQKIVATRNYWSTTDENEIRNSITGAETERLPFVPFRLQQIDTDADADIVGPLEPIAVDAFDSGNNIAVTWEQVLLDDNGDSLSGFKEYRVYSSSNDDLSNWKQDGRLECRTSKGNGPNSPTCPSTVEDTSLIIPNTAGSDSFFRVTAVDTATPIENESYFSNIVSTAKRIVITEPADGIETNVTSPDAIDLEGFVQGEDIKPGDAIVLENNRTNQTVEASINASDPTWQTDNKLELESGGFVDGLNNTLIAKLYDSSSTSNLQDTDIINIMHDTSVPVIDVFSLNMRVTPRGLGSDTVDIQDVAQDDPLQDDPDDDFNGKDQIPNGTDHIVNNVLSFGQDTITLYYNLDGLKPDKPFKSNSDSFIELDFTGDTAGGNNTPVFREYSGTIPNEAFSAGDTMNFIIQSIDDATNDTVADNDGAGYEYQINWTFSPTHSPESISKDYFSIFPINSSSKNNSFNTRKPAINRSKFMA